MENHKPWVSDLIRSRGHEYGRESLNIRLDGQTWTGRTRVVEIPTPPSSLVKRDVLIRVTDSVLSRRRSFVPTSYVGSHNQYVW